MKTLKEELKNIIDKDLLNKKDFYICNNLSNKNKEEFMLYRSMARNYAKKFLIIGGAWWDMFNKDYKFIISEKYRFIKDLIAIL